MPIPNYTDADFCQRFQDHLPLGEIWPRDSDAVVSQVSFAIMQPYTKLHQRSVNLLTDAFPPTAVELLPEWEATLGLPDPCDGPDPTISLRQAHVVARLTQQTDPSIPSLTAFASALLNPGVLVPEYLTDAAGNLLTDAAGNLLLDQPGYTITIQEFAPARYGRKNYGQPRYGKDWAFVWQITTDAVTIAPARYGSHRYGEPYRTWGGNALICEINRIKPAHTILLFNFIGPTATARWDVAPGWNQGGWAASLS